MKKFSMIAVTAVAALSLAGNGVAPISQSANVATTAYAAKKSKISNEQYAVMAYLKVDGQSASDLSSNASALTWQRKGNKYIVSLNDKTTKITVGKTNVKVAYHKLDSNGSVSKTEHKTFSKAKLAKQYKKEQNDIKNILSSAKASNNSNSSSASSASSSSATANSQVATSSSSQKAASSTQQSRIKIAGHSFHRQNFYGTEIWVGDNGEGELGEWYANDPSVNTNQNVANQVNQANNGAK